MASAPDIEPTITSACSPAVTIRSETNLGPLTTPVKFPAICTNQFNFHTTILGQPAWSDLYVGGCALSQCCPSSRFYTSGNAWYSSYFSPGVCPQGYITCNGSAEVETKLAAGESARFCCPGGYKCPLWPCYSICVTLRTSETTALVVDGIVRQSIYSTETLPARTSATIPYDYAYPIQIRWKDSDFVPETSSSTTPSETGSGPSSGTPQLKKGLSAGVIAAIAVVISLLVLAGLVVAFWRFRKRPRANSMAVATDIAGMGYNKAEMDGTGVKLEKDGTEVPVRRQDNQVYELEDRITTKV